MKKSLFKKHRVNFVLLSRKYKSLLVSLEEGDCILFVLCTLKPTMIIRVNVRIELQLPITIHLFLAIKHGHGCVD